MKYLTALKWIPKIVAIVEAINKFIPIAKMGEEKLKLLLGIISLYIDDFEDFGKENKPKILKFIEGAVALYVKAKKIIHGAF